MAQFLPDSYVAAALKVSIALNLQGLKASYGKS
jgi:hypothetical protein